jgi:hypothetical protein
MSTAAAATPLSAEVIDYDALYADYSVSLVDTLRGFSAKVPGLELWVPDENLRVSLRNLLDSAANLGRASVCLQLGERTAGQLSEAQLLELGQNFGQARVERRGSAVLFEVSGLGAAQVKPVAPAAAAERKAAPMAERALAAPLAAERKLESFDGYERRLRQLACVIELGASAPSSARGTLATFTQADCTLRLLVGADHVVLGVSHDAPDEPRQLLLAELGRLVTGLPILEACFHGALRLEYRLRPKATERPVSGIVLPRAVHPHFALVEDLLRGALASYRSLSGFDATRSQHDDRPRSAWLAASAEGRKARLDAALAQILPGFGLATSDVAVVSIRYDVRVELGLSEAWKKLDQPRLVLALERELQATVDPRLEVYVQELKDKNQLRRLALVETP